MNKKIKLIIAIVLLAVAFALVQQVLPPEEALPAAEPAAVDVQPGLTIDDVEITDAEQPAPQQEPVQQDTPGDEAPIPEDGVYDSKEEVALYIHTYGRLPANYITKAEARELGWEGGSVEAYAPGMCIGGDRFGNYEGILPEGNYTECDIDTLGYGSRGSRRIVFSDDGRIYYTHDHYESFERLY